MEYGKISDAIQATIDLLESVPVKGRDLETTGLGIMTAIRNLKLIKDATVRAENGDPFTEENKKQEDLDISFEIVDENPDEKDGEEE